MADSTPKSKRRHSRRSSILKPQKPRQPLQTVDFDPPHEKGSTPSRNKRRVSFADKKHVKEFCHSIEQGTVWDSTYEEHDSNLKGSFVVESKNDSKENVSSYASTSVHIFESNLNRWKQSDAKNNQLFESIVQTKGEENTDFSFIHPTNCTELFGKGSQNEERITSPNKSAVSQPSENASSNGIFVSGSVNDKYVETFDERSPFEQSETSDIFSISRIPKTATIDNIIVYRDLDKENMKKTSHNFARANAKYYPEYYDVDSKLETTRAEDLSMEFTTPIHTSLLSSCAKENTNIQKDDFTLRLNLSNLNKTLIKPIQATSASEKPVNSNLGIFEQISRIQNREDSENNTCDKTMFSTNVQSNLTSENTVFKQIQDATPIVNESMMLTNVIQPSTANADPTRINNTAFDASMEMTNKEISKIQNCGSANLSAGDIACDKTILSTNLQSNLASKNTVFKQIQDATQIINKSMTLTNIIQPSIISTDATRTNNAAFNASMEMTAVVSSKIHDKSISHVRDRSIIRRNDLKQIQTDKTELFNDVTMEMTKPVNMLSTIVHDKQNIRMDELISKDDRTIFFRDVSMEMTKALSTKQEEITHLIDPKLISEESIRDKKDTDNLIGFNDKIDSLCESMELTEAISLHDERTLETTICTAQSSFSQTKAHSRVENFTLPKENESMNIENARTENCCGKTVANENKHNREIDCLTIEKTIINDNRINESNHYTTNVENSYAENVLSTRNNEHEETIITEEESIRERINDDAHPQNNVQEKEQHLYKNQQEITCSMIHESLSEENANKEKVNDSIGFNNKSRLCQSMEFIRDIPISSHHEKTLDIICTQTVLNPCLLIENSTESTLKTKTANKAIQQYSDVQRLEVEEESTDRLKTPEIIENQLNSVKYCNESLNDEVRAIRIKQNEECVEQMLAIEECVSATENVLLTENDLFLSLLQKLETYSESDDVIWNIYHKNIDRKLIVCGFVSNSLLIAMFLSYDLNCPEKNLINKIKIISRIADDSGVFSKIVHKLILEKLDAEQLVYRYETHEDILPMLEHVSQDVKSAMDFMFDLKDLDTLNLMEITSDEVSFLSQSKKSDIIVRVTIKIKRFDKLTSKDVNVDRILGTIKETDIKDLIKNIKKDHMFLRKYMKDVKDYVDVMEMTAMPKKFNCQE